jgi:hypothetical protein
MLIVTGTTLPLPLSVAGMLSRHGVWEGKNPFLKALWDLTAQVTQWSLVTYSNCISLVGLAGSTRAPSAWHRELQWERCANSPSTVPTTDLPRLGSPLCFSTQQSTLPAPLWQTLSRAFFLGLRVT